MKTICSVVVQLLIMLSAYSQEGKYTSCKSVQDSGALSLQYFKLLFSNSTGHAKSLALVKLEFKENDAFYVTELKNVKSFCKWKYNVPDSNLESFVKAYLISNPKLDLSDTLFFSSKTNQFRDRYFNDSVLCSFRNLGIKRFLMKYFEGTNIKSSGAPLPIVAFLYEKRIFWENISFKISAYGMRQIESEYKVKWDDKTKQWLDLRKS